MLKELLLVGGFEMLELELEGLELLAESLVFDELDVGLGQRL